MHKLYDDVKFLVIICNMSNFNPIKEDKDGIIAKRTIWSTSAIKVALKGLQQGRKLVANPFYENNTQLLKSDLVFERTPGEIEEWKRCASDILYFAEKYCQLMTPEGIQKVTLRDYQKKYLLHLVNHRLSIYLACRQCGKTTTSAIYMLWYVLFNFDKNALVIADVRKHAIEILDKTKKIFYELPYFLKPGINKWNENEIVLDNGCRIMASATTITAAISYTFHEILWDEAAHLQANIQEKFYNNLFPTITAAKAKFMITSTQNGYNLFYRLYKAAEAGENEYAPFKTDWYEVPEWNPEKRCWEERDEEWHKLQVANYGSEEAFNSQFGTEFDVGAKTLLHRNVIRKLRQNVEQYVYKDLPGVSLSENYHWKEDYEPAEQLRKDFIVITGDLAEGVNKDYTHFNINRLIEPGSGKIENIGYYRSNDVDRREVAKTIMEIVATLCDYNNTLVSFEKNTYGEFFLKLIEEMLDDVPGFDMSCLVKYYNDTNTKFEYGIKITRGNKNSACILFKEDFEKDLIKDNSALFVTEIANFTDSEDKGVWKAAFGHDDCVMSMVQIEFVKKTLQYILLKQDFDAQAKQNTRSTNPYDFGFKPFEGYFGTPGSFGTMYDVTTMPTNLMNYNTNQNENRLNRFS